MTGSSRELILQASALLVEAFDALAREQAATRVNRDMDELVPAHLLARERGFSTAAVSRWCKEHPELRAERAGDRGRWRLSRTALNDFLTKPGAHRRSPRNRRRRSHLSVVDAA